jgi:hypothetical protein
MFAWWQNLESVIAFNAWVQIIAMVGISLTTVSILLLWFQGSRMTHYLIEREESTGKKIKAVEKAAEQIRKELLATQQNQDIADQRRRLAEMDADSLRKEVEKTRKRYSEAEGELKDRIEELKGMNITHTTRGRTTRTTTGFAPERRTTGFTPQRTTTGFTHEKFTPISGALDSRQRNMLSKLLSSGPKGELDIISVLEDPKSHEIATDLKTIFDEQGWSTSEIIRSAFTHPPDGFLLIVHSKQTAPSYAKFLQRTLTTMGLPVSAQINNKYPEWSISMVIGHID